MESILDSTKDALGLALDYDVFDSVVKMHINSTLSTLNQLGVGPADGFEITGNTETWASFLGADPRLNSVKTYVFLQVRLLFDPPTTSYLVSALESQSRQLEWRLNTVREEETWVPPVTVIPEE